MVGDVVDDHVTVRALSDPDSDGRRLDIALGEHVEDEVIERTFVGLACERLKIAVCDLQGERCCCCGGLGGTWTKGLRDLVHIVAPEGGRTGHGQKGVIVPLIGPRRL